MHVSNLSGLLLQGIYDQLNLAAEAFLEGDDGCQVDMNKGQIKLSQILKWYSIDFGKNKEEVKPYKFVCIANQI